jgi:hypothetical protein
MNNTLEKHLTLTRADLTKQSAHHHMENFNPAHIKGPQERFWHAETVVFVENDGTRKVLKDRHGALAKNRDEQRDERSRDNHGRVT